MCGAVLVAGACSSDDDAERSKSPSSRSASVGCDSGVVTSEPLGGSATGSGETSAFFSNAPSVPQAEDCDGMRRFLSEPQPGFDLQSYVFYGHLESSDGDTIAFSALDQRSSVGAGSGAGTSDVAVISTNMGSGTQLGAFAAGEGLPTVMSSTSNPFSARATVEGSFVDIRVVDGQLGEPGATIEITTVNDTLDASGNPAGRTEVWLRATDRAGVAQWGYGPSGFFPQWIQPDQRTAITDRHGGSVGEYLATSDDPMTNQGSYYYTSPFLDVEQFSIARDGKVVASGTGGQLVADYVTQTFDAAARAVIDNGVTWTEFTTFIGDDDAMKIGEVSQSSVGALPYAVLVTEAGDRHPNGSLEAQRSWPIDAITITPDTTATWTSPRSNKSYATRYTVTLTTDGEADTLTYTALYDDQELDVGGRIVYEGIFTLEGTLDGRAVTGYAWGEIQPTGTL